MTVKELRESLENLPDDTEVRVLVFSDEGRFSSIRNARHGLHPDPYLHPLGKFLILKTF